MIANAFIFLIVIILAGLPLASGTFRRRDDAVSGVGLLVLSAALGACIFFIVSVAVSVLPPGERWLKSAALWAFTVVSAVASARIIAKEGRAILKSFYNPYFAVWALFAAYVFASSLTLAKGETYPGAIGIGLLGDQIEYSALADNIVKNGEYFTEYYFFNFAYNVENIKKSVEAEEITNHVSNRLPFFPYLAAGLALMTGNGGGAVNLSITLCVFSAILMSGAFFTWLAGISGGGKTGASAPMAAALALALSVNVIFAPESVIGCFEAASITYALLLLVVFGNLVGADENNYYRAAAMSVILISLFYVKGEGVAFIGAFMLVYYIPGFQPGKTGVIRYILPFTILGAAMAPWALYSAGTGAAANLGINNIVPACPDGGWFRVKNGWFREYTNRRFHTDIRDCEFSAEAPAGMDEYEKYSLQAHLKHMRSASIWELNYYLGSQAYLVDRSAVVPEADASAPFLAKVFAISGASNFISIVRKFLLYTVTYLYYYAAPFVIILAAAAAMARPGLLRVYIHFLLFAVLLSCLNMGARPPRFQLLYAGAYWAAVLVIFECAAARLGARSAKAMAFAFIFVAPAFFAAKLYGDFSGLSAAKRSEEARMYTVISEASRHSGGSSTILSSVPQYVYGMTGKASVGHAWFCDFLPGYEANFNPDVIIFMSHTDADGCGAGFYEKFKNEPVLSGYEAVYVNKQLSAVVVRKKRG